MKEAKDYKQALRTQLAKKSDPEGQLVLEPQSSSELVHSGSRPSYNVVDNGSSRKKPTGGSRAASNRARIPNC